MRCSKQLQIAEAVTAIAAKEAEERKREMEVEIEKCVEAQSAAEVADREEQIAHNKESRAQVAAEENARRTDRRSRRASAKDAQEIIQFERVDFAGSADLSRLLRLYPPGAEGGERWELKADPRPVEILVSQMGQGDESEPVSTPGVRMTDEEELKEFDAGSRACYRSWTMRASYLIQDRCQLQFALKELARRMQQPSAKNMQALERLVRFLKGSPRCLVVYGRQAEQQVVDVFSDSDLGEDAQRPDGRLRFRTCCWAGILIASSATTQNAVATSLGEAEFHASTKSASGALGAVVC